jgi:hypothetical protein
MVIAAANLAINTPFPYLNPAFAQQASIDTGLRDQDDSHVAASSGNNVYSSSDQQEQTLMNLRSQIENDQVRPQNPFMPPVAGKFFLGSLTNQWWNWIFSVDIVRLGGNPIFDKTGALCDAGIQRNGMLFLVGTGGVTTPAGQSIQEDTSYQRTCTTPIRHGTPILIPILNSECSPIEFGYDQNCNHQPVVTTPAPPCPQTQTKYAAALRSEVSKFFQPDHAPVDRLNLAVDGVPLTPQRAQSPGLGHCMTIKPNNPFSVFGPPLNVNQPTTVQSISDGYWALVTNLQRGPHTLTFGGTIIFPDGSSFVTQATYHLTVV